MIPLSEIENVLEERFWMLINSVKIGDRLEICSINKTENDKKYKSQVEDIIDKDKLLIHMPISYGQIIKLQEGTAYSVLVFTGAGIVTFDTKVMEHKVEDGFNLSVLMLTSSGERVQRREFFRFVCLIPTKFSVQEKNDSVDNKVRTFEGIIKDIGGGGLKFVSNEPLAENDKIKVAIILNTEVIIADGKILQKQFFPKSNYKFQYRVEFIGIQKTEQDVIVQYIFEQQRKILQKTKI